MNIETFRDLLFFIMKNRVESTLYSSNAGPDATFYLYVDDKRVPRFPRTDEIVAVKNDYVIIKIKGPGVIPNAARKSFIIQISSILQIVSDFDFLGAR